MNCFRICIFDSDFTTPAISEERLGGCELLSNLYLWLRFYNKDGVHCATCRVVNCFRICIFDSDFTTQTDGNYQWPLLWIAFEFVSLTQILQPSVAEVCAISRCELLSNLYLWLRFYNASQQAMTVSRVVNCFRICIFDSDFTTLNLPYRSAIALWIAFEFVSLTQILQPCSRASQSSWCCELLSNLYLWLRFYNN